MADIILNDNDGANITLGVPDSPVIDVEESTPAEYNLRDSGARGEQGPVGEGVPAGGSVGQVLAKNSDADYDTEWIDPNEGTGDVVGPDGSIVNAISFYDSTTGKLLGTGTATLDTGGNLTATEIEAENIHTSVLNAMGSGMYVAQDSSQGAGLIAKFEGGEFHENYLKLKNAADTEAPSIEAASFYEGEPEEDTNIDINIVPKGSGRLQASGVNLVTVSSSDTLTNKTLENGMVTDDPTELLGIASKQYVDEAAGAGIQSIVAGTNVTVDDTDPRNPIINASGGGGGGGSGDVTGPASSTDNALPRFDGTSGKALQGSGVTLDDSDNLTVPGAITSGGAAVPTVSSTDTLTNKTVTDDSFTIQDNSDNTKKAQFQASGISTGTTRTLSLPNVNGTLYATGGTDVSVADGGTGRSTSTTPYGLIAAGTTATGAHQTLAAGATTQILVGGGTSALPVWTTATGTGAPVRASSPTLTAPLMDKIKDTSGNDVFSVSSTGGVSTLTLPTDTDLDIVPTGAMGGLYFNGDLVATYNDVVAVEDQLVPLNRATRLRITQSSHGFSVGNLVRWNGTEYTKSQADSAANAEVHGMVSTVTDANNFTLTTEGAVPGLSGLTSGSTYFLSPTTAGAYTTTEPTTVGQISKPLFVAESTTSVIFHNYRGIAVAVANTGWSELGRTTLGAAGDAISVSGFSAKKYIRLEIFTIGSGTLTQILRFNNDSSSNYTWRSSVNGGADTTSTSTTEIRFTSGDSNNTSFITVDILNVSSSEKFVQAHTVLGGTGASTAPPRVETVGKWVNTSSQITRIDLINTNTGDFAIGSEVLVLGKD